MAGFDYAKAAATAKRLLDKFGQVGAIRRVVSVPGPDEWTPGTTIETDYPIQVAVLPIDLQNVGRDIEGSLIKSTDKQLLIAAVGLTIEPTTTDLVLVDGAMVSGAYEGGNSYMIIRSNPLAPAGAVVMYDAIGTA